MNLFLPEDDISEEIFRVAKLLQGGFAEDEEDEEVEAEEEFWRRGRSKEMEEDHAEDVDRWGSQTSFEEEGEEPKPRRWGRHQRKEKRDADAKKTPPVPKLDQMLPPPLSSNREFKETP